MGRAKERNVDSAWGERIFMVCESHCFSANLAQKEARCQDMFAHSNFMRGFQAIPSGTLDLLTKSFGMRHTKKSSIATEYGPQANV